MAMHCFFAGKEVVCFGLILEHGQQPKIYNECCPGFVRSNAAINISSICNAWKHLHGQGMTPNQPD